MIRYKKIRIKLQLFLGISILLIVAILGVVHITTVRSSLYKDYREKRFYTVLRASQSSFESILQRAIETSELLAEDPTLIKWFASGEKDSDLKQLALKRLDYLQQNYNYNTVFAVNKITRNYWRENYNLLDVISDNDPDDSWFLSSIKSKTKTSLNFDYNRELNRSILFINVLMGDINDPIGVAGVGITPSILAEEFNIHKTSENSKIWLVDSLGKIIMSENVNEVNYPISRHLPRDIVSSILKDNTVNIISESKIRDIKYEVAYLPIYHGKYKLITMVPDKDIFPVLTVIQNQTIVFSILFLLISLFIVSFLSRGITNPLIRLKMLSDAIATGDLETSPDHSLLERKDEIGILARAFEHMKKQLAKYIIEINTTNKRLKVDKDQLKNTNDQLNIALKKASESERLTQSFLANISHEIRTPMNSIVGFSQLLENCDPNSEEYKQYTDLVLRGSQQLLTILDSIINLSKIEAGVMKPKWEAINIGNILNDTYDLFLITAQKENLELILKREKVHDSIHIESDRALLQQILNNLLTNAVKYTNEGFIRLGCQIENGYATFFVEDTGIGISKEDQEIIFEPFRQIHQDNKTSKKSGAGLGLAIVNKIVSILNGKISMESTIDKGSIFYIKFPIKTT